MTVQWLWVMVWSWVLLCTSYYRSCADISKYDDGKRFIWESQADGAFAIFVDGWDKPFGQGAGTKLPLNELRSRGILRGGRIKGVGEKDTMIHQLFQVPLGKQKWGRCGGIC